MADISQIISTKIKVAVMHLTIKKVLLLILITPLLGCAPSVKHYENQQPNFDIATFFTGDLTAFGVVQDFSGEVTRRFSAEIKGRWQGNQGILDESFLFDDGEVQYRCWQLRIKGDRLYGTAGDVVGEAVGQVSGNTLHWQYVLQVALDDGDSIDIYLDDWLYLVTEDHLINRTKMSKFGLPVGEVTLSINRVDPASAKPTNPSCQLPKQG